MAGVSRTQGWLRRFWVPRNSHPGPIKEVRAVLRAHRLASRVWNQDGQCLASSMVLWATLQRRGFLTTLRVGMRKFEGTIQGHAWVELDGVPLNESPSVISTYTIPVEPFDFDR